jgi:hypothetical protein
MGSKKYMKQFLLVILIAMGLYLPAAAQEEDTGSDLKKFPVKFSATVDMQVEKQMYDEFYSGATNRISNTIVSGYRQAFDDFWMRIALKGSCNLKYFESKFNMRFYPYWTMRRKMYIDPQSGTNPPDLLSYLDAFEIAQAYFKVFKTYTPEDNLTFQPQFKVGRDGMLNNSSQLFGNYLDQPAGGYGDSRYVNITGPFKNRKIFANQLSAGFEFNIFDMVGGKTDVILGGNLNNQNYYNAAATQFFQIEDSKLSAGFFRIYQDLYILNERFHLGGGFRKYVSVQDSAGYQGHLFRTNYITAQWAFDVTIIKDLKFYTEMAMQKMSSDASTGIVRPINIGFTLPTFGVLDQLTIEWENVAPTYFEHNPVYALIYDKPLFNPRSMRDAIAGRSPTRALGWGITLQKKYFERFIIDWGVYTGNPTGDMKTTLRLTSNF